MTFPNMDLQSLPTTIELRVGTDQAERALQLSYYQVWSALQALNIIDQQGLYPEQVVNAGDESSFDSAMSTLLAALVAALVQYDAMWAMLP